MAERIDVPALLGITRIRIAPSIGLRRHRPWVALDGKRPKRGALFLAALALTGCTTTRYTRVYCVTRAQFEQLKSSQPPKVHDRLTGDASQDIGIIAGSAIRLRAHDDGLLEVLGGCVDPNAP